MSRVIAERLAPLLKMQTVLGVCLHRADQVLHAELPPPYTAEVVDELCAAVAGLAEAYGSAGPPLLQLYLSFEGGTLLAVRQPTKAEPASELDPPLWLSFLLSDVSSVAYVVHAATALLGSEWAVSLTPTRHAAVVAEHRNGQWRQYSAELSRLLAKVIGSAQTEVLLRRVLTRLGADPERGIAPGLFAEVGRAAIAETPNRVRRETLFQELDAVLKRYA